MTTLSKLQEQRNIHTRLLRVGLAVEDSRAYWRAADPKLSAAQIAQQALEQRWFGAKSIQRVNYLVTTLGQRLNDDLQDLRAWDSEQAQDRAWACHWHLQRTDPLYQEFTDGYLRRRLFSATPTLEKVSALEWLHGLVPNRWNGATADRLVSGLFSSVTEAGFCGSTPTSRLITPPSLSDQALAYLFYLLKRMDYQGSLMDNPYLRVATLGDDLPSRLRKLQGVTFHTTADVVSLDWHHRSFKDWLSAS